uniref:COR413-TM1 n=1 Tax=Santalum album TaxID=35974 RepID=A0A220BFF1_SANAL|nr:COR413-TM1 [Santalum album]
MGPLSLSLSLSLQTPPNHRYLFSSAHRSSSCLRFHPLRISIRRQKKMLGVKRGFGAVCYAAPLNPWNLQWICTISSAGEYGTWTAFLALLVRLFFFLPGELELPFVALLLVIVAPYQSVNLRGTQGGHVISLIIAAYLAYQHFSRAGSLRKAFNQGSIVATLAIICAILVPFLFLI